MTVASGEAAGRSLTDQARALVEENRVDLPPLPELATRVQAMLSDEDVDTKEVALLIGSDPAIASTLLRRANSVAFGGLREITDIVQAVARLGLKEVEALVTTAAVKGTFHVSDPNKKDILRGLWDHSLITGLAAKRLALKYGHEPEAAFLAGLLHDVGRLVVLKSIDALQEEGRVEVTDAVLEELMEVLHCELGYQALENWNLPEEYCRVARHHEEEQENADDFLMLAVQAGDAIACKLGFHDKPDPELALLEEPSVELLNLGDIELATIMVDLEDEFEALQSML